MFQGGLFKLQQKITVLQYGKVCTVVGSRVTVASVHMLNFMDLFHRLPIQGSCCAVGMLHGDTISS